MAERSWLEGGKPQRGRIPGGHRPESWVTPGLAGTDPWREQGFEVEEVRFPKLLTSVKGAGAFVQRRGSKDSERSTARQGGNASKGEPRKRSRHEIGPGRLEGVKTVKGVGNPVGGT